MDPELRTITEEKFIQCFNNQAKCIILAPNYFTY
jgi:hypothetical protein